MKLKDNQLIFCRLCEDYLNCMYPSDNRLCLKDGRIYIGVFESENKQQYVIPLTTSVNKNRISKFTQRIYLDGKEAGAVLFNNILPVREELLKPVIFTHEKNKDFLIKEYIFLKKYTPRLINKAKNVLMTYNIGETNKEICVDVKRLIQQCNTYSRLIINKEKELHPHRNRGIHDRISSAVTKHSNKADSNTQSLSHKHNSKIVRN